MAGRRELTFACLDDVMTEVERLPAGHETVGPWSLGQSCNHMATAVRLTMEVPPDPAAPPVPGAVHCRPFRSRRTRLVWAVRAGISASRHHRSRIYCNRRI
ncbi:MAG: DUF1569 domain-containing protein [Planctomycetaceae bacterium]